MHLTSCPGTLVSVLQTCVCVCVTAHIYVTHTSELRAAWPSWCCCHADIEPIESPGEPKPCREESSALLREYSRAKQQTTINNRVYESLNHLCAHTVEPFKYLCYVYYLAQSWMVSWNVRSSFFYQATHRWIKIKSNHEWMNTLCVCVCVFSIHQSCRQWACLSRPGLVVADSGWWRRPPVWPEPGNCLSSECSAHRTTYTKLMR